MPIGQLDVGNPSVRLSSRLIQGCVKLELAITYNFLFLSLHLVFQITMASQINTRYS